MLLANFLMISIFWIENFFYYVHKHSFNKTFRIICTGQQFKRFINEDLLNLCWDLGKMLNILRLKKETEFRSVLVLPVQYLCRKYKIDGGACFMSLACGIIRKLFLSNKSLLNVHYFKILT